ncbi:protein TolQ [bacterium]|nr:protein TolQ [bacterium]
MDPVALAEIGGEEFSLFALFLKADLIVKIVMGILVFASVWSWAVAFDRWLSVSAARRKARQFEEAFWSGAPIDDISDRVSEKPSDAMARVFSAGAREWKDARRVNLVSESQAAVLVERARAQMAVAVNREGARMEQGLPTLAIIASSSPFIGLFGTVIGIMNAFRDIAVARETNLAVVAPGMAEALFATALGLGAAIPALIFYNKFVGDVGKFTESMDMFAQEFAVRLSRRLTDRRDD